MSKTFAWFCFIPSLFDVIFCFDSYPTDDNTQSSHNLPLTRFNFFSEVFARRVHVNFFVKYIQKLFMPWLSWRLWKCFFIFWNIRCSLCACFSYRQFHFRLCIFSSSVSLSVVLSMEQKWECETWRSPVGRVNWCELIKDLSSLPTKPFQ